MLRPLSDFVLVARDPHPEKTDGGIIIPDVAKEDVTRGVVMASGPGQRMERVLADELDEAASSLVDRAKGDAALISLIEKLRDIGARLRNCAPPYKKGDKVLFGKYSGNAARIRDDEGEEHDCVLARADEIYGLIE